ncbi:MAG: hypothetical protein RR356_02105 [Bacteroidales bacterium]
MMKKYFIILMTTVILCSCHGKDKYAESKRLLLGTWKLVNIDGLPVETDESFVCTFDSLGNEIYACGQYNEKGESEWMEGKNYTYKMKKNTIKVKGSDPLGKNWSFDMVVVGIDEKQLLYSVKNMKKNDVQFGNYHDYTLKRVTTDCSKDIKGIWVGQEMLHSPSHHADIYCWEFLEGGKYNFYYKDSTGTFVYKEENDGRYFLYDNFLVCNFKNDLKTNSTGKIFECWNITVKPETMVWSNYKGQEGVIRYSLNRVDKVPVH